MEQLDGQGGRARPERDARTGSPAADSAGHVVGPASGARRGAGVDEPVVHVVVHVVYVVDDVRVGNHDQQLNGDQHLVIDCHDHPESACGAPAATPAIVHVHVPVPVHVDDDVYAYVDKHRVDHDGGAAASGYVDRDDNHDHRDLSSAQRGDQHVRGGGAERAAARPWPEQPCGGDHVAAAARGAQSAADVGERLYLDGRWRAWW